MSVLCGCQSNPSDLREGDILFADLDCGPLCDAIRAVTDGVDGREFAHCGMVVQSGDTLAVVEAIGRAVQMVSVAHFKQRASGAVVVGRLKQDGLSEAAAQFVKAQVGVLYDDAFLPNNGKWYCSELVQVAYREANGGTEIFPLNPMTFNDPATGQPFAAWVDYYKALQQPIPEAVPGINPGLMSRSAAIEVVR